MTTITGITDSRKCNWAFTEPRIVDCCKDTSKIGVLQCRGCGLIFCTVHAAEHREALKGRRTIIERAFYEWKSDHSTGSTSTVEHLEQRQSLMDEIERWENISIERVRRAASVARQQVVELFTFESVKTSEPSFGKASWLEQRLKEAYEYENFHEAHLKRWEVALECLREHISSIVSVRATLQETDLLVRNITLEGDQIIQQAAPPVKPVLINFPREVNIALTVGDTNCATSQCELESGVHEFRIKSKYVCFGIGPKNPRQRQEPGFGPVIYGWTADSHLYIDGQHRPNCEPMRDPLDDDEFILTVDCEQHMIFLMNVRTGEERQMNVDIQQCPLPWQLCIQFMEGVQT